VLTSDVLLLWLTNIVVRRLDNSYLYILVKGADVDRMCLVRTYLEFTAIDSGRSCGELV